MSIPENYYSFFIPPGREIIIKSGGENIFKSCGNPNIHLIVEDGISLDFKNNYAKLLDVKSSSLLNLLSNSLTVNGKAPPTGQFALQALEVWESTDNLSFSIDASLYMVTSGLKDVLNPSLVLVQTTLPKTDPNKGSIWGKMLIPPGPNIAKILQLSGVKSEALQSSTELISLGDLFSVDTTAATGVYDIEFGGYLTIPDVVITSVQPSYSEQLDEDLCPVSCKININFQTVEVATQNMITNIINSLPTSG